jgi:hypothetical protein
MMVGIDSNGLEVDALKELKGDVVKFYSEAQQR